MLRSSERRADRRLDRGDLAEAALCFQRSLTIQERTGLQRGIVWSRLNLGHAALQRGAWTQAEAHYRWCLSNSAQVNNQTFSGYCWTALGLLAYYRGDLAEAEDCYRRSLPLMERSGDRHGLAECWLGLGTLAATRGDQRATAQWCRDARRLAHHLGNVPREALACLGEGSARGCRQAASAQPRRCCAMAALWSRHGAWPSRQSRRPC